MRDWLPGAPALPDLLDADQRAAFARDGYLVVPGVVGQPAVDAALQIINHWLDSEFESSRRHEYHGKSFAPEHVYDPEIVGLLTRSDGLAIAASLVGRPLVPPAFGQIALRFPVARGEAPVSFGPHLDGISTTLNGVPPDGQIRSFTALAGVCLSDCPSDEHGNFTVWPGSHLETARWMRAQGTSVPDPDAFLAAIQELADATSTPLALRVRAGDLVLTHFLLLHGAGVHQGPGIRYAVFFRLSTEDHDEVAQKTLTNPWYEWPAYHGAADRARVLVDRGKRGISRRLRPDAGQPGQPGA